MLEGLKKFLYLWNPLRKKFYIYYEPTVPGKISKTIVKAHTKFEAAYNSPGRRFYIGKYADIEDVPSIEQIENTTSLKKKVLRRVVP